MFDFVLFSRFIYRWLISKVPELKHNQDDKKLKRGSGYYFMQPSDPQWHFSSLPISDDNSAFAKTIAPIYSSPTPADVCISLVLLLFLF